MVLQTTGLITAEINTGKYDELFEDNQKLYAKKYFNKSGVIKCKKKKKK
jgi:hypothetical protein